ncbi:MAG: carbonic anhydrase [Prevotella sp.]|jgi:carbonic anhydrase|nr:carbonic anhydrase [Prevotella sp.]
MKRTFYILLIASLTSFSLYSCSNKNTNTQIEKDGIAHLEVDSDYVEVEKEDILANAILTKDEQAALTPNQVFEILKVGNKDFVTDNLTVRNTSQRIRNAALGQYPKAVVLSCLDSRVPVEDVFHRGIGDIFVARVAGNVVNEDILASLEYACKVSGSKLVVVLGHEYCGAIKSAIDDVKLGNITGLLSKIKPAIDEAGKNFTGDRTSKNADFVQSVCDHK